MSDDLVDNMELEALSEEEFGNNDSHQCIEDLFAEALDSIKVEKKKVDRMHQAGVSPSVPVVEINTWALAAKEKGGSEV